MQYNKVKRIRILGLGFATSNCEELSKTFWVYTFFPFKIRRLGHISFKGPCGGYYGYSLSLYSYFSAESSCTAEASKIKSTFPRLLAVAQ